MLRNLLWLGAGWLLAIITMLLVLRYASSLILANGNTQPTATAAAAADVTPTTVFVPQVSPAAATPQSIQPPASCAEFKKYNPGAEDGEYTLYWQHSAAQPILIYCHNMDSAPADYLTLVNVGSSANFSSVAYPGLTIRTEFTRLRIDLQKLVIDRGDITFATTDDEAGAEVQAYATAIGCQQRSSSPVIGQANIDLGGTPFVLDTAVQFTTQGPDASGDAVVSSDRRRADLSASGGCGWTWPQGELQLVYAP